MSAEQETIDATPTWSSLVPVIVTVLRDGNSSGVAAITSVLRRMAQAADNWNEYCQAVKAGTTTALSPAQRDAFVRAVLRGVCELPYTSPEHDSSVLTCTADELRLVLQQEIERSFKIVGAE